MPAQDPALEDMLNSGEELPEGIKKWGLRPQTPRGKEVKPQGVTSTYRSRVLATRKPKTMLRPPESSQKRYAERRSHGKLTQEPPRTVRVLQFPSLIQAPPSPGAPL